MSDPMQFEVIQDKEFRPTEGSFVIRTAFRLAVPESAKTLPLNLCLLIDRSGSMSGAKIARAKEASGKLVSGLNSDDVVSLITFSDDTEVLVEQVKADADGKDRVLGAIDTINPGGTTRMDRGLDAARDVLSKQLGDFMPVLLMLSDGAPTSDTGAVLDAAGLAEIQQKFADFFTQGGLTSSTVGLGDARQCMADFLETAAEKGGGVFYPAVSPEKLAERFMEEYNRVRSTAVSDVRFFVSDILGKIRKATAVYPDVREITPYDSPKGETVLDGGALQKGDAHVFLVEIVTPEYSGGAAKQMLCNVRAKYRMEGRDFEASANPPLVEYTDEENLLRKEGHPEVEKYKAMYTAFIQTQRAAQNIRSGVDSKKTQKLLESAAKTTKKLGMAKQTKILEDLKDKVAQGAATENDIVAASVDSRKTKVMDR